MKNTPLQNLKFWLLSGFTFLISLSGRAQSPAYTNTNNPVVYCDATTDKCWGPPKIEWKWDCYMACAKAGDTFKDMTEVSCSGEKRSAYDVMSNGKPLLLTFEGWDCGNCKDKAPTVSNFMNTHKDKFNFWLAYGGIGGGAKCGADTDNKTPDHWQKQYPGFKNAFAFLDNDFTYIYGVHSLAHYTLVDPRTKKIVMITHQNEGNDPWGRISKKALELAAVVTSFQEANQIIDEMEVYPNPANDVANISFKLKETANVQITLNDIIGKEVLTIAEGVTSSVNTQFDISSLPKGMYTVDYKINDRKINSQKLMIK